MEQRIAAIVAGMTVEQKVGQITQPEIKHVTPDQVRQYYIGSVLNGGGSWPAKNRQATPADWAALSDAYYAASMASDMKVPVPVIWGIDAVHGHNNAAGATLFPHNIGLGAAHDPALIHDIGRATAKAVRATGITWVFAPTLAVVQDQRWGRSYESFSADPRLVRSYAAHYVRGLQGSLTGDGDVVATAKHFIGDGGTFQGKDQGETRAPLADLINVHGQGYYGALGAGVQTVMASYNSWNDVEAGNDQGKLHGSKYLLTNVLKDRMGFDGFVISDWDAIQQVSGCTISHCPRSINAGVDMVMVPEKWQDFIANTLDDVRRGVIPMSRLDDAVTRILRVKMRSGLFAKRPVTGVYTGQAEAMAARALARQAVSESLVLLKNQGAALPLAVDKPVLVVGKSADSFPNQAGGWSVTWQGDEISNADFTTGDTLLTAIRAAVGAANVVYSETGSDVDLAKYSAVIAVIGETPYAESKGDIVFPATMQHSARYPADLAVLKAVSGRGVPVVTVFYSGRTAYANDLINASDAFVAAWLPGTEAKGITDVIFRTPAGGVNRDFRGRLSFAWPGSACDSTGDSALFKLGYGASYAHPVTVRELAVVRADAGCAKPAH